MPWHSFSVLKFLFIHVSPPLPVVAHHGFCISPTILCACVTAQITAGACLCFSEKVPISLYNTLNPCTLWLHGVFAWVLIFESKSYETEPCRNCASPLALSWLWFRRCLRWMTISLSTLLAPEGKYVHVCVCSVICGGFKRVGHGEKQACVQPICKYVVQLPQPQTRSKYLIISLELQKNKKSSRAR